MDPTRVVIAGAAGRDFHNFNVVYRGRDDVEVVAFTATQIPNIDGRVYPRELAGDSLPVRVGDAKLEGGVVRFAGHGAELSQKRALTDPRARQWAPCTAPAVSVRRSPRATGSR